MDSICIWKNTYAIKYFFDNLVIIQEKLSGLNIMAFILLIDICPLSRMIYIIIVWPSVPGLVGTSDLWIIVAFGHKQLRRTLAANRLPKWFKNVVASGHNRLWSPLEAKFRTSTMRWSLREWLLDCAQLLLMIQTHRQEDATKILNQREEKKLWSIMTWHYRIHKFVNIFLHWNLLQL